MTKDLTVSVGNKDYKQLANLVTNGADYESRN